MTQLGRFQNLTTKSVFRTLSEYAFCVKWPESELWRRFRLDESVEQKQIINGVSVKKPNETFINIDLCHQLYLVLLFNKFLRPVLEQLREP